MRSPPFFFPTSIVEAQMVLFAIVAVVWLLWLADRWGLGKGGELLFDVCPTATGEPAENARVIVNEIIAEANGR